MVCAWPNEVPFDTRGTLLRVADGLTSPETAVEPVRSLSHFYSNTFVKTPPARYESLTRADLEG
jgi:hypothetical protein